MVRVLIADNHADFTTWLSREFMLDGEYDLVHVAVDGARALEAARMLLPDIMIVELVLPLLDGIAVIDGIRGMVLEKTPHILITSMIDNGSIIKRALEAGASSYLKKPFDLIQLKSVVSTIMGTLPQTVSLDSAERRVFIESLLIGIGVPTKIKGFCFLCDAILSVAADIRLLENVTKILYPAIARQYGSKPGSVERSIRHAIEVAWTKGKISILHELFGYTVDSSRGKPTNSEFIAMLAEHVRLASHSRLTSQDT